MAYLGEHLKVTHQGPKNAVYQTVIEDHCTMMEKSTVTAELQDMPYFFSEFGQELTEYGVTSNIAFLTPKAMKIRDRTMRILGEDGADDFSNLEAEIKMGFRRGERMGSTKWDPKFLFPIVNVGDPLIEMNGVSIRYGDKTALGDWKQQYDLLYEHLGSRILREQVPVRGAADSGLRWTVRQGERWAIVGSNGE